ncbi:Ethylene receptor 2 [Acorus gramineus]|uniref:Ethylene receptor n=1 Tax=Acorus gramineus TaxID=55184 RepID=A0AAV9AAB7_ACOGR|nr:Ethylene receptor 2 [Acorus gramineus]
MLDYSSRCVKRLFFISSIFFSSVSTSAATGLDFPRCYCDGEGGIWSIDNLTQCQKVSDFLIAAAYFSIPLELVYFISCSNAFPFKWVLVQFSAFIILCGLTHVLTMFTYAPHSFSLMLSLTVSKILTALVSFMTAITLVTLIPQLLRVKYRELFLRNKTLDLDQKVGMMKKQEEANWHVRMLTQEIRKSLDRHTILYTTLVELSKTLALLNCAVWMPNADKTEMNLTHELKQRKPSESYNLSIPIDDPDVLEIKESEGVKLLRPDSVLGLISIGEDSEPGIVAAIRMPMLRVSDFKRGTPEVIQACYAILVLVLPGTDHREWSKQEMKIVKVVADQVAVALSHASVLEESQMMREKLEEQNRALQRAREDAMMASRARNSFQKAMGRGMRRPSYSISGLLSMMQQENFGPDQKLIIDTMAKTSEVISALVNDVTEVSPVDSGRHNLEAKPFQLHDMIRQVSSLSRCLCICGGYGIDFRVENSVPDWVVGDEKRVFQVILHMVGNLVNGSLGGVVTLRVLTVSGIDGGEKQRWAPWKPNSSDGYTYVKFEMQTEKSRSIDDLSSSAGSSRTSNWEGVEGLSFSMCKRLVQMMQGNIWAVPNSQGLAQSMTLVLRLQLRSEARMLDLKDFPNHHRHQPSETIFRGLRVLLADDDDTNRAVTGKLLMKLGCRVFPASSGLECLCSLGVPGTSFQVILLDIHMPDMDGFEVSARIQNFRASGAQPLVVALTTSCDEDLWDRCLLIGMKGVIRKPVTLQGIRDELRRVLQQANQGIIEHN